MDATQRNATRNQSTADYESKTLFIFDNRFLAGVFKNNSGGAFTLKRGMLVVRNTAVAGGFLPATDANLADVIGICAVESDVVLANNGTVNINIATKGTVDGNNLVLPAAVTLDTAEGNVTVRDILNGLGFNVDTTTVQNQKFDN